MVRDLAALSRYRLGSVLARRWAQYAALLGVIAIIGGVAMGAVVAARTTQSAYPAYLKSTNASDLTLSTYGVGNTNSATYYSPQTAAAIARVPGVTHVESWIGVFAVPLEPDGAPNLALTNDVNLAGSKTGLYFSQDRVTAVQGRVADPRRVNEFMTTALGARLLGVHVGEVVPVGLYTPDQSVLPGFGTSQVPPARRFALKLVGIVKFNNEIVEDDADRLPTNVVYTPAFTRLVPDADANGTWYGIQLARPARIAATERDLFRALPPGAAGFFSVTAVTVAKVERAVRPETIALAVFGLIAALAGLGIAMSMISRSIQATEEERSALRALGAGPSATLADALVGLVLAVVVGSVAACGLAVALSGLAPLGPVRSVYHPGVAVDWTVLGTGLAVFIGGLTVAALLMGIRSAPERLARRQEAAQSRSSRLAQSAAGVGLPLPAVLGLRFALEPGSRRSAVPPRSVLTGAAVALTTVTATLTFGNSLRVLVTHPSLYGWAWTYTLLSPNGVPPRALTSLSHDGGVAAWTGYNDPDVQLDGQTVPALTTPGIPTVQPPILSGHLAPGREVVLGPSTLALLHKRVGETVDISYGSPNTAPLYLPPTPAVISGTATFPAVAGSSTFAEHISLGTGVLLSDSALPPQFLAATQPPDPVLDGPALVFVRMRPGVSAVAGQNDMKRIVAIADQQFNSDPQAAGDAVTLLPIQRPAEIVNYQSTGAMPELLASALGAGAALALAVTLASTARRRNLDLAVLKTIGFTGRQVASTLRWQATASVAGGVVIGVPLGIVLGRELWSVFARSISVVPAPSVPLSVVLVAVGALVLAVVVAAVPGWMAARTPAAVVLRQE